MPLVAKKTSKKAKKAAKLAKDLAAGIVRTKKQYAQKGVVPKHFKNKKGPRILLQNRADLIVNPSKSRADLKENVKIDGRSNRVKVGDSAVVFVTKARQEFVKEIIMRSLEFKKLDEAKIAQRKAERKANKEDREVTEMDLVEALESSTSSSLAGKHIASMLTSEGNEDIQELVPQTIGIIQTAKCAPTFSTRHIPDEAEQKMLKKNTELRAAAKVLRSEEKIKKAAQIAKNKIEREKNAAEKLKAEIKALKKAKADAKAEAKAGSKKSSSSKKKKTASKKNKKREESSDEDESSGDEEMKEESSDAESSESEPETKPKSKSNKTKKSGSSKAKAKKQKSGSKKGKGSKK
jgi:hypothetical protein